MTTNLMHLGWTVVGIFSFLTACGTQPQGGLANVPAIDRRLGAEDRGHDVIANGPESCGGPKAKGDRSKRPPQCQEGVESPGKAPGPPPPGSQR
jgi:hypothetical protein